MARIGDLRDVTGETGTNAGGMIAGVRDQMARLSGEPTADVRIADLLAIDTFVPTAVRGAMAGEIALENAVALAAMVRTTHGPMAHVADGLRAELTRQGAVGIDVRIGGIEAEMAVRGALTTPGTARPIVVVDLGGGSTDAAAYGIDGAIASAHLAGAGDLVTRLIDAELGIDNADIAESVKKYPLGKVDGFFTVRHEDGTVEFFADPLAPEVFARVVTLGPTGMSPIPTRHSIDRIRDVRRSAKQRVFVTNAVRALQRVAPNRDLRSIDSVVLLGGCALDFEIPQLIADELAKYGIVCGTGNVRGTEGPRNAVASGLVIAQTGALA